MYERLDLAGSSNRFDSERLSLTSVSSCSTTKKMAKKGKDDVPNPNSVSNRDIIQRLNFLYQAGVYMDTISSSSSASHPTSSSNGQRIKPNKKRKATTSDLSKAYISSMKVVGQKTTVKLFVMFRVTVKNRYVDLMPRPTSDPAVKRTICKGCNTILIPGSTVSVRVKSEFFFFRSLLIRCCLYRIAIIESTSHGHAMVYMCTDCRTTRRIPAPPTLASDVPSHASTSESSAPPNPDLAGVMAVDVTAMPDATQTVENAQSSSRASGGRVKARKKTAVPRRPPLFARDVGHVVFCGNERLDDTGEERGNGIYIT